MAQKYPVYPQRVRKIPKQFSWVDHRLVRDGYIEQFSHEAATLYLFLVTVADAQGLSYYSDRSITQRLSMDEDVLKQARKQLIGLDIIAYKKPIYQVLDLDRQPLVNTSTRSSGGHLQSLAQIFKQITEEGA